MGYFQNILSDSISGKTCDPEAPYNQDTSGPPLLQVNNLYSTIMELEPLVVSLANEDPLPCIACLPNGLRLS